MTWRRFFVLLSGLPPHSSYVQAIVHRRRQEQEIISDPEEAERYVAAMLG